jgi:hypothetical protein
VLSADVVVLKRQRLPQRQLQHLLGARREWDLAGAGLLTRADNPQQLLTGPFEGDAQRLQYLGGKPTVFAE